MAFVGQLYARATGSFNAGQSMDAGQGFCWTAVCKAWGGWHLHWFMDQLDQTMPGSALTQSQLAPLLAGLETSTGHARVLVLPTNRLGTWEAGRLAKPHDAVGKAHRNS
jgi:hypothetical protein